MPGPVMSLEQLTKEKKAAAAAKDFKRAAALQRQIKAMEPSALLATTAPAPPTAPAPSTAPAPTTAPAPPPHPRAAWLTDISTKPSLRHQRPNLVPSTATGGKHPTPGASSASSELAPPTAPTASTSSAPSCGGESACAEDQAALQDPFTAVVGLSEFVREAEKTLAGVVKEVEGARGAFNDLLNYFCEVQHHSNSHTHKLSLSELPPTPTPVRPSRTLT
jgi:hypothetical protein